MKDLDVCVADINPAYLQAPTSEKHYIICGDEFGHDRKDCVAVITRALYGEKSAGGDDWKHMHACMEKFDFTSSLVDTEVWRREAMKSDGKPCWEYICLYVDD